MNIRFNHPSFHQRDCFRRSMMTIALLVAAFGGAGAGCVKKDAETPAATHEHKHQHTPPHGGTAVELGDEAYHLEFVRDAATGTLTAFVLDAHMENFVRLTAPSFEVIATVGGERRPLTLAAVASNATGETVGDTSQFQAQADWLKTTGSFAAQLTSLTIRGTAFSNVAFQLPAVNPAP